MSRSFLLTTLRIFPALSICFLLLSCATTRSFRPREIVSATEAFKQICRSPEKVESATGNLWLKIKSKEVSGQFAAQARVDSRSELDLEVLNFLGGTEAVIRVRGTRYEVRDFHGKKVQEGVGENGVWAGLPMRWAHDLFLGRVPCPDLHVKADGEVQVEWVDDVVLRLTTPLAVASGSQTGFQEFNYRLSGKPGELFPESLKWSTRLSNPVGPEVEGESVEFRFDGVDFKAGSFRKWEAHSNRGDLKVVWRDREVLN